MMDNKNFHVLWGEALTSNDRDTYVSDWATSSIFSEDADLLDNAAYLGQIWDAAHMDVRAICKAAGLSQVALAQRFCIPLRTVQNWCNGQRPCADYIRLMIAEALDIIQR